MLSSRLIDVQQAQMGLSLIHGRALPMSADYCRTIAPDQQLQLAAPAHGCCQVPEREVSQLQLLPVAGQQRAIVVAKHALHP